MNNYEIRELPGDEFRALLGEYGKKFFEDQFQIFSLRNALPENELNKINALK